MENVKKQILNQVSSNQAKQYIEKHIFDDLLINNVPNPLIGSRFDSLHHPNSSSMLSSYLPNFHKSSQKMSIKSLLNRIQKLIVMNGLYKTLQEIKDLKDKTTKLQKTNQQISIKLNHQKNAKSQTKQSHRGQLNNKKFSQTQKNPHTSKLLNFSAILSFKEQIKDVRQKIEKQKVRQNLISLVKLSKQQQLKLLQKTQTQYQNLKKQIERLQKVIQNTQLGHPEESCLIFELDQLEKEVEQKRILLYNDKKVQTEIQKLQRKVHQLEQQKLKSFSTNKQNQTSISINQLRQKTIESERRIRQLEDFIKQENSQKELLFDDINKFRTDFQQERLTNERLLKKIKDNFYSCPEIIDFLIKEKNNPQTNLEFIFKELQIQL